MGRSLVGAWNLVQGRTVAESLSKVHIAGSGGLKLEGGPHLGVKVGLAGRDAPQTQTLAPCACCLRTHLWA